MLYKPRKPQFVSARLYPGEDYYPGFYKSQSPMSGTCNACGRAISDHLISNDNKTMVCPNTYILYEGAQVINMMSRENFEAIYEPIYAEETI